MNDPSNEPIPNTTDHPQTNTYHRLARVLLGLIIVMGIAAIVWHRDSIDVTVIRQTIESLGPWRGGVFILIYIVAALIFIPGSILTLSAGALFGPYWGTLWSLIGATLGAVVALVVSRYVIGQWIRRRLSGRLDRVIVGVEEEGWRFVAFTRLVPIFPYNMLNYAMGVTRIKVSHFAVTSFVTMAPGSFVYANLGHAGAQVAAGEKQAYQTTLVALALVAVLALGIRLYRRRREARAQSAS